jgi:hypothetical protein
MTILKKSHFIGKMARPERFELPTFCFEGRCSIQLSYGRILAYCTESTVLVPLIRMPVPAAILEHWTQLRWMSRVRATSFGMAQASTFSEGVEKESPGEPKPSGAYL